MVDINLLTPDAFLIVEDSETTHQKMKHRKSLSYLESGKKKQENEDEDEEEDEDDDDDSGEEG